MIMLARQNYKISDNLLFRIEFFFFNSRKFITVANQTLGGSKVKYKLEPPPKNVNTPSYNE